MGDRRSMRNPGETNRGNKPEDQEHGDNPIQNCSKWKGEKKEGSSARADSFSENKAPLEDEC